MSKITINKKIYQLIDIRFIQLVEDSAINIQGCETLQTFRDGLRGFEIDLLGCHLISKNDDIDIIIPKINHRLALLTNLRFIESNYDRKLRGNVTRITLAETERSQEFMIDEY